MERCVFRVVKANITGANSLLGEVTDEVREICKHEQSLMIPTKTHFINDRW